MSASATALISASSQLVLSPLITSPVVVTTPIYSFTDGVVRIAGYERYTVDPSQTMAWHYKDTLALAPTFGGCVLTSALLYSALGVGGQIVKYVGYKSKELLAEVEPQTLTTAYCIGKQEKQPGKFSRGDDQITGLAVVSSAIEGFFRGSLLGSSYWMAAQALMASGNRWAIANSVPILSGKTLNSSYSFPHRCIVRCVATVPLVG
jgi:hypothetical protein